MLLILFLGLLFFYSLISGSLEKTVVTAPIVFTAAGMIVYFTMGTAGFRPDTGAFLTLSEIGLVLLLFTDAGKHSVEFTEEWGQILNLSVFFLFGLMVARSPGVFGLGPMLYALLSLTLVRMLPVAVSLAGTGLGKGKVAFMGWFGPRGLASIVLGLVYLEEEKHLPGEQVTRLAVMATVLLSIFAHGLTAAPGIRLHARTCENPDPEPANSNGTGA